MNTFLLLLGLTATYYVLLFYFDKKRKKTFQLAKNNAIGKTTELALIEQSKPKDLFRLKSRQVGTSYGTGFGKTDLSEKATEIIEPVTIVQKAIAAKNVVHQHTTKKVTEDLYELAGDLEAAHTPEIPKDDLEANLKASIDITGITETEAMDYVKSLSPKLKR